MRDGSRHRGAKGRALALGTVLVLAGCSTGPTATPPVATSGAELVLAAFGDSITADPSGIYVCAGCTPFVDRYAEALTTATGTSVDVRNLARPSLRVAALLQDLMATSSLTDTAASADAIIVGVGNSDAPWNITDDACDGPATSIDLVPWEEYTDECITTEVERFRPTFDAVFKRIVQLRAGEPTILRTINRYNDWIGFVFEGEEVPPEAVEVSVAYNVAWNEMICETAEANDFECGDVGRAFNGPDGRTASGDLLAPDYIHPSDKGHERIAAVLVELGFAPLAE